LQRQDLPTVTAASTPTPNKTFSLCFYLVLPVKAASVTVVAPGETESGSAGEQPDKG